ncbi:MAG: hypothetical protein P8X73_08595 [Ignavibacteriaceae bacterium]
MVVEKRCVNEIPDWVRCGLRVINLFSSKGNMERKNKLERKILNEIDLYIMDDMSESNILLNEDGEFIKGASGGRRTERKLPAKNEAIIQVCLPKYWTYLFHNHTTTIEQILNEIGIENI